MHATEYKIPAAMFLGGFGLIAAFTYFKTDSDTTLQAISLISASTLVGILLSVLGCYITAAILGIDFGPLLSAIVKFAGIIAVSAAMNLLIPAVGFIVAFFCYFGLLIWLFDLEPFEALVCSVVIFLVRLLAAFLFVASTV